MELTKQQLDVIKESIVRLDCYSCQFLAQCQSEQYNSLCREIKDWAEEQERMFAK